MIDFTKSQTELLLNPKLQEADVEFAKKLLSSSLAPHGLIWLLTSGSSGYQKLVGLSREALLASAAAVNRHLDSNDSDKWLLALPEFHVGGLSICARAHLSDASILAPFVAEKWSAQKFLDSVIDDECTLSALVPTQVFDLVKLGEKCPATIRAIVVGGGAIDPALYKKARTLGYPLLPSYGLTECCSQVATASIDSLESEDFPPAQCLDHVEVKASESGKLLLKSKALLDGYLFERDGKVLFKDPKQDGWFETDDRGKLQGAELVVYGRDSKFVKISGENVDLNRLEKRLSTLRDEYLPKFDAVIVAKPEKRVGNTLILVVERCAEAQEVDTLRDKFNAAVMPFERIGGVAYVDEIPRSELGKVKRVDLGDLETI